MPDVSNPTHRVIDILNLLAAHPTEAFSLAEIARQVGLTNGSAHRILTTMASARFLSRDEKRRTYSLGIAVVAVGQAAVEKHRGVEVAREELNRLAMDLNVQCSANTVIEGEILVLVKEGKPQSHRGLTRVGERRPLIPPMGLCHIAWSGKAALDAYLALAGHYLSKAAQERLLATLPLIRRRGFAIAANGRDFSHSRQAAILASDAIRSESYWSSVFDMVANLTPDEVQLIEPDGEGVGGISSISAPVFSPTGSVALQLVLTGMAANLSSADIERYVDRLCAVAATITSETHGRQPECNLLDRQTMA